MRLSFSFSPSTPSFPLCRQGRCKLSVMGRACEVGLRRRHYYILSGSVLGVWTHLEAVLARHSGHNRMQIARVQTSRKRLVGEWLLLQAMHMVCYIGQVARKDTINDAVHIHGI